MIRLNNDWEFVPAWSEEFLGGQGSAESVRIPHTVQEMPLHYSDPRDYQMVCGYRRVLRVPEDAQGKRLFLQFDGAAHIATVFCNGQELATHKSGYTAFRVEITDAVKFDGDNLVAVKLDTTENPAIPPFGFVIDYLTYGGIYRDVWLDIRPRQMITDVFVYTPTLTTAKITCEADMSETAFLRFDILNSEGKSEGSHSTAPGLLEATFEVPSARPWSTLTPTLYTCRTTLVENGEDIDCIETTFGFRTVEFTADSFYLNGVKMFLRGLNRHQSWPYVGYAVPEQLQREDARIVKHELQCNTVRTSHYPQSHYFIDECDKLGLMVFTELPGWQHIGDEAWKDQACENVREMVLEYRNHPSIILWGVRINESQDDDEFYTRTNAIAHELDPSRPTSGVRYLQKSNLLEDVYAFNDFSHSGKNPGAVPKRKVTTDMGKALLISEANGHMYPTKSFDTQTRRQEQALRHARVLDAAMSDGGHVGCYQWCMFDYPTHKDFGSGDCICYHGVMDSWRNPKLAAAVYASQGEMYPVLEVGSSMDIGDYDGGKLGDVYAFTNAEEVLLYKNGALVGPLSEGTWRGLAHGPMELTDTIGELLESQEGFEPAKAKAVRECLLAAAKYGVTDLPLADKAKVASTMRKYQLSMEDVYALYGKYVGNWGGESTQWRFDAVVAGEVVASVTKCPTQKLHLEARTSHTALTEGDVYDMASVRVRILDEFDNVASYAQLPVTFTLEGDAELVGPAVVTAEGAMCGTYIRTIGKPGTASLTISTSQTDSLRIDFTISEEAC